MSKAVSAVAELPGKIISAATDLVKPKKPEAPEPAAPAADVAKGKGPADPAIEARSKELETRQQSLGQRAAAAGAVRSENDADVLGYTPPRRRSAARAILG